MSRQPLCVSPHRRLGQGARREQGAVWSAGRATPAAAGQSAVAEDPVAYALLVLGRDGHPARVDAGAEPGQHAGGGPGEDPGPEQVGCGDRQVDHPAVAHR